MLSYPAHARAHLLTRYLTWFGLLKECKPCKIASGPYQCSPFTLGGFGGVFIHSYTVTHTLTLKHTVIPHSHSHCHTHHTHSHTGGGKGSCRFCGSTSNTGLLAIGNVCVDPECQERAGMVCDKTLSCGHTCCGVKGEEKCLPCLLGCTSGDPKLKQDADDMCMICYTEGLSCAPCVQVRERLANPL